MSRRTFMSPVYFEDAGPLPFIAAMEFIKNQLESTDEFIRPVQIVDHPEGGRRIVVVVRRTLEGSRNQLSREGK